jgi:Peptidase family M28
MLGEIVDQFLGTVPIEDVMTHLARVAALDRYQASRGIALAAEIVASAARAIGLTDVAVEHFPADGAVRWWSFRAPESWTPTVARLKLRGDDRPMIEIDHAVHPFSVATYSAPTRPGGVVARLVDVRGSPRGHDLAGAIAVVGKPELAGAEVMAELLAGGAIGFLSDAPSRGVAPDLEYPGRIELPPGSPIFAFSLTPSQMAGARAAAAAGAGAFVEIDVDRSEAMPIVTGVLPGDDSGGEVWLTAHLCHPRPGANDNASGVAALLGIAAAHVASRRAASRWRTRRAIRFFWGPEFVGVAAFLHRRMALGEAGLPSAVINLDMVGEDQAQCGCPFVIERSPNLHPTLINPIAERVMEEVFARTSAFGGAWRSVPFAGFSDHALFADPRIGRAAVQLCHVPDRFNHSAADTLDKVSALEMMRATGAGASLAWLLGQDGALLLPWLQPVVRSWCAAELRAAQRVAAAHRRVGGGAWSRGLLHHVRRKNAELQATLNRGPTDRVERSDAVSHAVTSRQAVVEGLWEGPFNTRAMLADLPRPTSIAVADAIRADKLNLALLFNFAIRADGRRTPNEIVSETSFEFQRPIDDGLAERLFGALVESGWVKLTPRDGSRRG